MSFHYGEHHPFTLVKMFDSFPNWAYVFYTRNAKNEILFVNKYYNIKRNEGTVAHTFFSYCDQHKIAYGYGKEDSSQLHKAGSYLLTYMLEEIDCPQNQLDTIYLIRKHLYFRNNQLIQYDQIIASQVQ